MGKRETELANQCQTTLITESDWELHRRGWNSKCRALAAVGFDEDEDFDLISVPSLRDIHLDGRRMDALTNNLALAVDIHQVEKAILLYHSYNIVDGVYLRLLWDTKLRLPKLVVLKTYDFGGSWSREPSERLVVTCMDFRLHRGSGLPRIFTERSAWLTYPGAAFAGVDARNQDLFFSDISRVVETEKITEVTLVSHTDCAKYASKYSWRSKKAENKQLQADLLRVAGKIKSQYKNVTVLCAIAEMSGDKVGELISVT